MSEAEETDLGGELDVEGLAPVDAPEDLPPTTDEEITQEASEPASDTGTETAAEPIPPKPRNNRAQKRIDQLTADKHELKGALNETQRRLAEVERKQQEAAVIPPPELVEPAKPRLEQFDGDYEQFSDALANYTDDKIAFTRENDKRADQAEAEQRQRQAAENAQREVVQEGWNGRINTAREAHEDFDVVALRNNLPVSEAMGRAIQSEDNGAEVLYFLGQNPERAARIATMDPTQAAIEIGKLSVAVDRQPTTPGTPTSGNLVSRAPAPPAPVKAASTVVEKDPAKMSQTEYNNWRNTGGGK
jgi:hypothetical protein